MQLLTGEPSAEELTGASGAEGTREPLKVAVALTLPPEAETRLAALEAEVAALKTELVRVRKALGETS